MVRRWALDALIEQARALDNATIQQALAANLGHPEKRVRQSAARLAAYLPDAAWNALWTKQIKATPQTRLTLILALLWRSQTNNANNSQAIDAALTVLAHNKIPDHRLQAVRLIILALGDYRPGRDNDGISGALGRTVSASACARFFRHGTSLHTAAFATFLSGQRTLFQRLVSVLFPAERGFARRRHQC